MMHVSRSHARARIFTTDSLKGQRLVSIFSGPIGVIPGPSIAPGAGIG